jgi:NAD(P)H-dependent flavin oxidoreductase YrpB (nitropropane dioxygenase family)
MVIETNVTKLLGIKHPIIASPMAPYHTTELTVAVSEAGGLGVLSHTNMIGTSSVEEMKSNMEYVVEHTDKNFGFNIKTTRMQFDARSLCREIPKFIMKNPKIKEQCLYALTSAGTSRTLPQSKSFQKLRESGSNIKHFHVAPALWLADKCVATNVDGVVITGTEGAGHQSYEKVSTLVLLQQFRMKYPDIPTVACGGFASGEGLAAALAMGAGAIAMGSRFIASKESEFHEKYKDIVPPAKAGDTTLVTGFAGPIRLWKNKYTASHNLVRDKSEKMTEEQDVTIEELIEMGKNYETPIKNGNTENGAVPLGQSIGVINSIEKVSDIIDTIVKSAENYIKNAVNSIKY